MKVLMGICLCLASALAFEYHLTPVKVDKGIYCFFGAPEVMDTHNNGNMVNSCYVDTGRGWLIIDSGPTYAYAKEAAESVRKIKPQPFRAVINTHAHDDHWLGNAFFADKNIQVIGPVLFKTAIDPAQKTRMQKRITPEAYAKTRVELPTRFIAKDSTWNVDGQTLRLLRFEDAHTKEDLVVYLPDRDTVFAGDLVFNDRLPSLRDGNINRWISALESIRALKPVYIIGGHGLRTDASASDMTYDYLTSLRDAVKTAIDEGIGIGAATRSITLSRFQSVALYKMMHAQNVETAYRTLEWEDD